jgi:hypothetical protein
MKSSICKNCKDEINEASVFIQKWAFRDELMLDPILN